MSRSPVLVVDTIRGIVKVCAVKAPAFGDLIEMGILDPTKVTRTALQNAASIAGLMVTTEAMVAEAPKKEAPAGGHAGHGHGGGMGDMDF